MAFSQRRLGIMQNLLAKLPLAQWLPPPNDSNPSPEPRFIPFTPSSEGVDAAQEGSPHARSHDGTGATDNFKQGNSSLLLERETSVILPPEGSGLYTENMPPNSQSHVDPTQSQLRYLHVSTTSSHMSESSPFSSRFISMVTIDHGTPPASPVSETSNHGFGSSTLSLVPTEVMSRSPSPEPEAHIAQARTLGIKIRDFAYENHGVPTAPVVGSTAQSKGRYELYRSARLDPPRDVMEDLEYLDKAWLDDAERRYREDPTQFERKPELPILEWRRVNSERLRAESAPPVQSDSPVDEVNPTG